MLLPLPGDSQLPSIALAALCTHPVINSHKIGSSGHSACADLALDRWIATDRSRQHRRQVLPSCAAFMQHYIAWRLQDAVMFRCPESFFNNDM